MGVDVVEYPVRAEDVIETALLVIYCRGVVIVQEGYRRVVVFLLLRVESFPAQNEFVFRAVRYSLLDLHLVRHPSPVLCHVETALLSREHRLRQLDYLPVYLFSSDLITNHVELVTVI